MTSAPLVRRSLKTLGILFKVEDALGHQLVTFFGNTPSHSSLPATMDD